MHIIKHNAHMINSGNASNRHDHHDPQSGTGPPSETLDAKGLWLMTLAFNHSCLPNANYSWVANLMVIHANCDIEPNEEILLTYAPVDQPFHLRQVMLAKQETSCSCALCLADSKISDPEHIHRDTTAIAIATGKLQKPKELEARARSVSATYRKPAYKDVPCLGLTNVTLKLGHAYLGPLKDWHRASKETRTKATACFTATLEVCLGIKLVKDPGSTYCELLFSKYSQPHNAGILALVALAELSYLSENETEKSRAVKLLDLSRQIYKLYYGENATFDDHHKKYRCTNEKKLTADDLNPPENWAEIKANVEKKPKEIPSFLR